MPCACALLAYAGLAILDGVPRTLRIQIDEWVNRSWGIHNIDRYSNVCEVAVARDGSRSTRCESRSYRHLVLPSRDCDLHSIYQRGPHVAFRLDHEQRVAEGGPCACTWEAERAGQWSTADCLRRAQAEMDGPKRVGFAKVAGEHVVRYRATTSDGAVDEKAYAPNAGCELMESVQTYPGTWVIPGARRRYRVASLVRGEPDARVFQVSPGYRVTTR